MVGLGNPGSTYERSRHNCGAETVALLARRHGGGLRRDKAKALVEEVTVGGRRMLLAFPQTYYNESGQAVSALMRRTGLEPDRLLVVHDELDLEPGTLKVKFGGGLAGNNGLRSIKAHLHTDEFGRIRIGVGKPPGREDGVDHVLRKPAMAERTALDVTIEEAADAVEMVLEAGIEAAMTRYNQRREPQL